MIPVLLAKSQRILLWGCTVEGNILKAELFYLGSHLPKVMRISDRSGNNEHKVQIPTELQGLMFPQKGQGITLRVDSG